MLNGTEATERLGELDEGIQMIGLVSSSPVAESEATLKNDVGGVPAMVHWVKNLTAAAQIDAEVQFQSPAWCSGLKDPALPQPLAQTQSLAQELPYTVGAAIKGKKKKKK